MITGNDANPHNEVEMIADSLMNNDRVLRGNNVMCGFLIKSVLKLGSVTRSS